MYTFTFNLIGMAILLCTVYAENDNDYWMHIKKSSKGRFQSPINIIKKYTNNVKLPPLRTLGFSDYDYADIKITNTGHTVRVELTNDTTVNPYILSGGPLPSSKKYVFQEFHFHWDITDSGSEHEINGHKYAMEFHLVHFNEGYGSYKNAHNHSDGICVVSFFGKLSEYNKKLSLFTNDLKHIRTAHSSIVRSFRKEFSWLKDIAMKSNYFVYNGSLTSSPFTECVTWIILTDKIDVSSKQINKFRLLHSNQRGGFINGNGRRLQPLNKRKILHAV